MDNKTLHGTQTDVNDDSNKANVETESKNISSPTAKDEERSLTTTTRTATSGDRRDKRLPSLSSLFSYLDDIRRQQGKIHLPESCIRIWAAEIVVAVASLHACGIICRDFYVAPEVQGLQPLTSACDWWSFGVLLFELLVGKSLHSCHPCGISTHTELSIPTHVSSEGGSLLKQLIQPIPHERLGAGRSGVDEIRSHPFFTGVDWYTVRG
ncbi:putative ribosomal protein S6 kinase delta-1 [Apostichopus japonicus]|uniref:Putative ribosomal protein S6 kinase delta-1 n=1 Tax=Stichopus japonicus TaxID=307972 RepID=A0A2G8LB63_STIJA|nr:putative ribosomal protein S6 kinase delta-1 [Apostichopus japonicus]